MHGAAQAGGSVVQPDVADDRLYRWVSGIPTAEPPRIGTVPNHFVVEVRADARHVAEAAVASLDAAWLRVCDAVWARFVEPACLAGNETQAIWDRQVGSFWEVGWTAGPYGDCGNLLVSCLRNQFAVNLDSRIWSALLVQMNGFGFALWTVKYSSIACSSSWVLRCVPRRICRSVIAANHRSTWLIQDALVGVKCRWKRGWPASQS